MKTRSFKKGFLFTFFKRPVCLQDSSIIPAPALVESNGHRFEDTAYNNYIADVTSSSTEVSNAGGGGGPPKKRGFFSSIFKKPPSGGGGKSNKKSNSRKKDYYEEEADETSVVDDDDDVADFDQQIQNDSNFFHQHLIDDINASMIAHPSSSILEANNTEVRPPPASSYDQHLEHEHQDGLPPSQPLTITRKRSMSKPTDLDEIMRLQEAEEAAAAAAEAESGDFTKKVFGLFNFIFTSNQKVMLVCFFVYS